MLGPGGAIEAAQQALEAEKVKYIGITSHSMDVATNRLVAKVASDHDKPGGLTVVRPGEEAADTQSDLL